MIENDFAILMTIRREAHEVPKEGRVESTPYGKNGDDDDDDGEQ